MPNSGASLPASATTGSPPALSSQARACSQRLEGLMHSFQEKVGSVVSNLSDAAGQMTRAAGTVTRATDEAGDRSVAVASASEEASTNVQKMATAATTRRVNRPSPQLSKYMR